MLVTSDKPHTVIPQLHLDLFKGQVSLDQKQLFTNLWSQIMLKCEVLFYKKNSVTLSSY